MTKKKLSSQNKRKKKRKKTGQQNKMCSNRVKEILFTWSTSEKGQDKDSDRHTVAAVLHCWSTIISVFMLFRCQNLADIFPMWSNADLHISTVRFYKIGIPTFDHRAPNTKLNSDTRKHR